MSLAGAMQFLREVLAAGVADVLLRRGVDPAEAEQLYEGQEFPDFTDRAVPALGPLPRIPIDVANEPKKILDANPARKRAVFQGRGPGLIAIATRQEDLAQGTAGGGILLSVGDAVIDEPPHEHHGEWWAVTDVAGSVLIAGEVS